MSHTTIIFRLAAALVLGLVASVISGVISAEADAAVLESAAAQVDDSFELRWHSEFGEQLVRTDGSMTDASATFGIAWSTVGSQNLVAIDANDGSRSWAIAFGGGDEQLTTGTYTGASGELNDAGHPVLAINIDDTECVDSTATFEILDLFVVSTTVFSFAADFQLGCGGGAEPGGSAQVFGAIRYNSLVPFDSDRTITGTVTYDTGAAASDARVCANAVASSLRTTCTTANEFGRYELADLERDDYYLTFTAAEGAFECFDARVGCDSATYLRLREPIFVNSAIDASLAPGCAGSAATIVGTSGDDQLIGTSGNDVIAGLGGNDEILGLGGNDLLCGGLGNDSLTGGDGDDTLNGGDGDDRLWGQAGNDALGGFGGNDRLRGGDGNDYLNGGDGDDDLNAGRDNDEARGGDGADVVRGGTGDDLVDGGAGEDYVNGNGGSDQVFGGDGNDTFVAGGPRVDTIDGGPGHDTIKGLGGADTVYGGTGNDIIFGGKQNDMIDGGSGTDDCNGGSGESDDHTNCEITINFES